MGADDLFGAIGPDRFTIGSFNSGDSRDVNLERPLLPDASTLDIFEVDTFNPDDLLISIDLTQEMDTDRVVSSLIGRARYTFSFSVASEPD